MEGAEWSPDAAGIPECETVTMPTYCGVCLSEEFTVEETANDGSPYFVCSNPFHGEPRVWMPMAEAYFRRRRSGKSLGAELGVWDKLFECVPAGPDFVPYGDVEDAFIAKFPDDMRRLIQRFGHHWRDPENVSGRFTASKYLSARLSELTAAGLVEHETRPASGPWTYLGTYEWWRRPGDAQD